MVAGYGPHCGRLTQQQQSASVPAEQTPPPLPSLTIRRFISVTVWKLIVTATGVSSVSPKWHLLWLHINHLMGMEVVCLTSAYFVSVSSLVWTVLDDMTHFFCCSLNFLRNLQTKTLPNSVKNRIFLILPYSALKSKLFQAAVGLVTNYVSI